MIVFVIICTIENHRQYFNRQDRFTQHYQLEGLDKSITVGDLDEKGVGARAKSWDYVEWLSAVGQNCDTRCRVPTLEESDLSTC
jgi:penicillin-binding protein-related factor A (putative recombinase)